MSTAKKQQKSPEELQAVLQNLIAQGRKDGMIRSSDLNAQLEGMDLTPEKIEEIYDSFEAMNIQVVSADLDLDLGDDLDVGILDDDIDLADVEEEDLVDPVDLAAEYNLDDPVRMYLKEIGQIKLLSAEEEGMELPARRHFQSVKRNLLRIQNVGQRRRLWIKLEIPQATQAAHFV